LSTGKFIWKIPSTQPTGLSIIRVAALDGSLYGTSGPFTIAELTLASDAMAITTVASTRAVIGKSYMGIFYITGGNWPYNMQVASGQLPPGLTLQPSTVNCIQVVGYTCPPDTNSNYMITGTPTKVGTYTFTLLATDASLSPTSPSAKKEFSITVYETENSVPVTAEIKPGILAVAPGSGTVYIITNDGQKYGFTSAADFTSRGFTFDKVQTVDKTSLDSVPETKTFERSGNLSFKYRSGPAIYYLTPGLCKQVYPSMTALNAWSVKLTDVAVVGDAEQYPDCNKNFVQLPENTPVKSADDRTVYVIREGKRRPFASYDIFKREGFEGKPVMIVLLGELDLYQTGEIIQ
jgi:hypothetical protein